MKAPDKIYFPAEGLPSYIDWDGSPIRTKQVEDSDVCYIRKDALMEWLEQNRNQAQMWFDRYNDREDLSAKQVWEEVIDKINEL